MAAVARVTFRVVAAHAPAVGGMPALRVRALQPPDLAAPLAAGL